MQFLHLFKISAQLSDVKCHYEQNYAQQAERVGSGRPTWNQPTDSHRQLSDYLLLSPFIGETPMSERISFKNK